MLQEEMIEGGFEVDVDLQVQDGIIKFLSISDNFPSNNNDINTLFLESGGGCPSILPKTAQNSIQNTCQQIISLYNTKLNGCFHFEAIVVSEDKEKEIEYKVYPIELNLRLGGAEVLIFNLCVYGIHLGIEHLKILLGIKLNLPNYNLLQPYKYAISLNQHANGYGKCIDIGYDKDVYTSKYLMGCMVRINVGDVVRPPPIFFDYLGWVVVAADSFLDAIKELYNISTKFFCILQYPYYKNRNTLYKSVTYTNTLSVKYNEIVTYNDISSIINDIDFNDLSTFYRSYIIFILIHHLKQNNISYINRDQCIYQVNTISNYFRIIYHFKLYSKDTKDTIKKDALRFI